MRKLIYIIFIAAFLLGFFANMAVGQSNRVNENGLVGNPDNINFTKGEIVQAFENKGYFIRVYEKREIIFVFNGDGKVLSRTYKKETYKRLYDKSKNDIIYWFGGIVETICLNEYC